jgi:hypothetical protein
VPLVRGFAQSAFSTSPVAGADYLFPMMTAMIAAPTRIAARLEKKIIASRFPLAA